MDENNNLIVELDKAKEDTLYDEDKVFNTVEYTEEILDITPPVDKKEKKKKPKKEFFWNKMSKKAKIITIASICLAVLLIILLLLYFMVWKKPKKEEPKNEVIVKKSSYIYENGKLKFIEKDKTLGTYNCKNKDPKKCYIAKFTNEDEFEFPIYQNENGKNLDKESKVYAKKYVFVNDGDEIVFYDLSKKEKIDTFKLIKTGEIDKDLVIVKNPEGKYALYQFSADKYDKLIDYKYQNISLMSSDERVFIKTDSYSFVGDLNGGPLSGQLNLPGKVKNFDNNFIAVLENDKYVLYDYNGKKTLKTDYDYMIFDNGYVFAINESELFVYDKSAEKLNEAPLKLKTNDYKTTYIFDKENNLKDTIKPYNVKYSTGEIILELPDKKGKPVTRRINLYEAAINKKYKYFKYLGGFIYIFDDEEKTNLIGTYSCTNENIVTSTTSSFNNCLPAKDTNIFNKVEQPGFTPIIGGTYAFIYDTQDGSTVKNIVLYDMKAEKNLVKYQEVDTGKSTPNISFISTSDELIFARNMDGNLGAIKIKDEGPTKVIAFKDDTANGTSKIEPFEKDKLLVTRGSSTYLYDKSGTLLAKSGFKIIEFKNNYLLVKNKGYLLYKMNSPESGTILTDELDFIKTHSSVYVGIKNRKLNVYDLNTPKKGLLPEELNVINTKLESSYRLTENNDGYIIEILRGDGKVNETHKYNKDWSKAE